jgi:purine nucleosidase
MVFDSGIPITMIPLDVTHQLVSTPPRFAALRALGNRCGPAVAGLLTSFEKNRRPKFGSRARALHDPAVIGYLLRPALYRGREVNVAIETESLLTTGMTVVDWWSVTGRKPNARFMNSVDADSFYNLLAEALARLP